MTNPMIERANLSLWLPDALATERCGASIAHWLLNSPQRANNPIVYLVGDLGAGKTTLTRGILRALGHTGPVKSPTYTLLEPYEDVATGPVYHFDFYRISDAAELEFIGIHELIDGPGIKLVEWPQRAQDSLPPADWTIELSIEGSGRRVQIC